MASIRIIYDLPVCGEPISDVVQDLVSAIRHDQKDQVLHILQRTGEISLLEVILAMGWAVHFRNKEILLEILRYDPENYPTSFMMMLDYQDWLRKALTLNQKEADGEEIFWNFDTLYEAGFKYPALELASVYPEITLIYPKTWPEIIPDLDQRLSNGLLCAYDATWKLLSRFHALTGAAVLTSLKPWCVENCLANVAFYLAMITEDWELMETLATNQMSLDICPLLLSQSWDFIPSGANSQRGCSAAVAVLKNYPLNAFRCKNYPLVHGEDLAKACKDQGLLDWALLLSSDLAFLKRHYDNCQHQFILDFILTKAVEQNDWDFAIDLLPGCSDVSTLQTVFMFTFWHSRVDVAKALMCRVDPSTLILGSLPFNWIFFLSSTVRSQTFNIQDAVRHMIRLCIASGMSTLQSSDDPDLFVDYVLVPLIPELRMIKLLMESGFCPHRILHKCRSSAKLESVISGQASEEAKKCYSYIQEAAASPCRLQHLARLTISRSIGCQLDRSERIQALPLPHVIKQYLRFRDILAADT